MRLRMLFLWSLLLSALLYACGPSGSPQAAVSGYLQDMVAGDVVRAVNHVCADWEESAHIDTASFSGVEARIEDLSCRVEEELQELRFVVCQGKIIATYQGEDQEIQLADRVFRVEVEGGEWRVCGTQ